jgi:hypothetical protein
MSDIPKTDPELIKAIAKEAGLLLENRAFTSAVRTLHQQLLGELLIEGGSEKKEQDALAQLRLLEKLTRRLSSMSHDAQFLKGAHNAGRRN